MGLSTNTTTYAGGAQTFAVNFSLGFLTRADVFVRVNSAVDGSGDPAYTEFSWIDDSAISVIPTLTIGDTVEVLRTVSKTELAVNFAANTDVTPANLDVSAKQGLMVYQELIDGRVDGTESPIIAGNRAEAAALAAEASAATASAAEGAIAGDVAAAAASAAAALVSENATAADLVQTNIDQLAVAADRIQVADDLVLTNADVISSSASAAAALSSENAAALSETNAETAETNAAASASGASSSASAAATSASEAAVSAAAAAAATDGYTQAEADAEFVSTSGDAMTGDLSVMGNVGIGNIAPSTALDVTGTVTATALDVTGTVTATSFSGDGSALTGLPAGYADSDVDTHLNSSTATSGEVLSYDGSDYDWIAVSSNATHTGEVTGSDALTIASDVVDADNLKVTGDGTTSQYLRSDGDGTFTWDTPSSGQSTSYAAVGTYAAFSCTVDNIGIGSTTSGSNLRKKNDEGDGFGPIAGTGSTSTASGTWRVMGNHRTLVTSSSGNNTYYANLFVRIS